MKLHERGCLPHRTAVPSWHRCWRRLRHARRLPCCCRAMQGKECMLFAGTAVSNGAGLGIITSIGMATEIGKIQSQIQVGSGPGRLP